MLKWTGLITKLEHLHPEFQMPNVKAKYFKKICNTTTVQFQHFLSLSHSLFLRSLPSLFRPATMKRPKTALMRTKTWDRGTHSHHSHLDRPSWLQWYFFSLWLTAATWVCHRGVYWLWLWVCHRGSRFCFLWVWVLLTMVGTVGCCIWCWLCWWWIGAIVFPLFFFLVWMVDYGLLVVVVSSVCSAAVVGLWWWWFQ